MIALPVVDLPQPDSPTRPSVSPVQDVEADVGDGVDLQARATDRELDDEVLDPQQRLVGGRRCAVPLPAIRRLPDVRSTVSPSLAAVGSAAATPALVARERLGAFGRADRVEARELVARRCRGRRAAAPPRGTAPARTGSAARTCSPSAGCTRSGGRPAIDVEPRVARQRRASGSTSAAPRCTGGASARTACAPAPSRRPARRTSPRCRRRGPATTPRSWVTRIIAMNRSRCCAWSRSRICACTVTSSAVVGSSAKSSFGPHASAIAIITRWRMPPESWCGYSLQAPLGSGMPTDCEQRRARSRSRSPCETSRW